MAYVFILRFLRQVSSGYGVPPRGALHFTLDDLKACEPYFEAVSPRLGQSAGMLMDAVVNDTL